MTMKKMQRPPNPGTGTIDIPDQEWAQHVIKCYLLGYGPFNRYGATEKDDELDVAYRYLNEHGGKDGEA